MHPTCCPLKRRALRHVGTMACREEVPPDVLESRFEALAVIRAWLLTAVGGCPHTRDSLLDLVSGRLTMTEAAKQMGWSVSKVSRVVQESLARIRWAARLTDVAQRRFQIGEGFTLDPDSGQLVGRVPAWAVSVEHFGVQLHQPPTRDDLMLFLASRAGVLRLRRGRRRYFGGWVEKSGMFWLDVTVLIADREAARAFARKNHQRCIANLATGEEITLSYRGSRRSM